MEKLNRTPFQGITNIVKFNWHFYIIAIIFVAFVIVFGLYFGHLWNGNMILLCNLVIFSTILSTLLSLLTSYYVYDYSNLYQLDWLNFLNIPSNNELPNKSQTKIVNINAGFDETSLLLSQKYPTANLSVFDFYDAEKHTEISIKRARKAYPAYPNTQIIQTNAIPLQNNSVNYIFTILSAHEIRNTEERIAFFAILQQSLAENGNIIVAEHLRDVPNFIAYSIGFLHFFSKNTWKQTFQAANLQIAKELKITPFISVFVLEKAPNLE
jgi:hypothetical protein